MILFDIHPLIALGVAVSGTLIALLIAGKDTP